MKKKVLSILIAIVTLLSCTVTCFAGTEKESKGTYVLVHGMLGWGENTESNMSIPYFGFSEDVNLAEHLRSEGYEVAVPSMGGLSSAWDRACEMFAQLTGTVVDYGAAHSAKYGHARYGRDYTGRGLLSEDWDCETEINLVGHSFGGPTATVFAYLMANGAAEEVAASPDDCSELFKGGHDSVNSVTTFESPHNGSPVANLLYDTKVPVYGIAMLVNIVGMSKQPVMDFMLDQWGITADPSTGKTANLNINAVYKLAKSDDNCAYDMSLQGAKDLMKYTAADCTYYYSYSAAITDKNSSGRTVIMDDYKSSGLAIPGSLMIMLAGQTLGGVKTDSSWAENDGMVPVVSSRYPQNAENNHADYIEGMTCEKGVWYVMPTHRGYYSSHGYGSGGDELYSLYDTLTERIANNK